MSKKANKKNVVAAANNETVTNVSEQELNQALKLVDSSDSQNEESLTVNFMTFLNIQNLALNERKKTLELSEALDSNAKLKNTTHRQKLISILKNADQKTVDCMLDFAQSQKCAEFLCNPSNIYVAQDLYKCARYFVHGTQFKTLENAIRALKSASRPLTVSELANKMCNEITRARYALRFLHYFGLATLSNAAYRSDADNRIVERASKDCTISYIDDSFDNLVNKYRV
jgi:hypothetical protein